MIAIEKYLSKRNLPKNIKPEDLFLFENELEKTIEATKIIIFNNIQFTYELLILKNGFIIENELINKQLKNNYKTIKSKIYFLFKNIRKQKVRIKETIGVIDNWSLNYFHWFTDTLPRLFVALNYLKNNINLILPIHYRNLDFISSSLKLFDNVNIIYLRTFQICNIPKFHFITHTAPTGNYNDDIVKNVGDFIKNKFTQEITKEKTKIIYISREKSQNRKIINEDAVIQILNKFKVEIYYFENLKWEDQVKVCMQTKVLISLHGAGLTNMLFMPENSSVLEFRKKEDNLNNCYFSLASALKIDYYYQLCEVDFPEMETQKNNFYINLNCLEQNLNLIIKDD